MSEGAIDREAQLEFLRRTVEALSADVGLETLLTRLIAGACSLIGADDGSIGLYDAERDVIRIGAVYRMPASELGSELRRGQGLAGRVLESCAPVIARYGDLSAITQPSLAENQVLGMPICWRGRLIGFFGIGTRPPRQYTANDLDVMTQLAQHAAIAIHNAELYAREQHRTSRFELITRIAGLIGSDIDLDALLQRAADAIHEMLAFPAVDIPLIEPEDPNHLTIRVRGGIYKKAIRHVDRLPFDRGIMGAAVRERRTQLVNDVAADPRYVTPPNVRAPRAELAVPIVLGTEVLGVLNVESDATFDQLDVASLEIIAEFLAVAMRNARLIAQAREGAVLRERQRIARELHDNITQILAGMHMLTETLEDTWLRDPGAGRQRTQRLKQLAQGALTDMRALLRELTPVERPPSAISRSGRSLAGLEVLKSAALPGALTRLLKTLVPETIELVLDFSAYRPQRLEHETALFRICQEAVSNALRHARARRIAVRAEVDALYTRLAVSDDGIGLPENLRRGVGLRSMQERAIECGGRLDFHPNSPQGVRVEATLPRQDRKP
jgi:signal transduction histidine kinase